MADDFKIDFTGDLNDPNYTGDGVDRRRWNFDEDGFSKATAAALMQAKQQMRERIRSIHDDIMDIGHPNDFAVTVDGTPIDKVQFDPDGGLTGRWGS